MGHRLDVVDLQKPKVRGPPMRLEQRILIRTEMSRRAPPMNGGVAHATEAGGIDRSARHTESHEAPRELVHDHEPPGGSGARWTHSARGSTRHSLSSVCPTNDTHEGPVPPGAGRERFASTRCTTCLSMSTPNVCEMRRAIRGPPNRGLRDLSATMAADARLARHLGARLLRARA